MHLDRWFSCCLLLCICIWEAQVQFLYLVFFFSVLTLQIIPREGMVQFFIDLSESSQLAIMQKALLGSIAYPTFQSMYSWVWNSLSWIAIVSVCGFLDRISKFSLARLPCTELIFFYRFINIQLSNACMTHRKGPIKCPGVSEEVKILSLKSLNVMSPASANTAPVCTFLLKIAYHLHSTSLVHLDISTYLRDGVKLPSISYEEHWALPISRCVISGTC